MRPPPVTTTTLRSNVRTGYIRGTTFIPETRFVVKPVKEVLYVRGHGRSDGIQRLGSIQRQEHDMFLGKRDYNLIGVRREL